MTKVIIVHGFGADKDSNWFPWLNAELRQRGFDVWCESLPATETPDPTVWAQTVGEQGEDGCILIGHSLGGPTILRVAEQFTTGKIKALFSVAGFARKLHLPFDDRIDPFTDGGFDFEKIKQNADQIHIWDSDDDHLVGRAEGDFLEEKLGGKRQTFSGRGHLNAWNKERSFPELLAAVLQSEHESSNF